MENLPLMKWKALYTENIQGDRLYDQILSTLETDCFDAEVAYTLPYLRECLPLYEQRCHEVLEKKMGLAHEVAKSVGFEEMSKLKRYKQARLIFESAMTLFLSYRRDLIEDAGVSLYRTVPELLEKYPEFADQMDLELNLLLEFANYMKVVLMLLPPKGKKAHLLEIVTRLTEGKTAKYVCGGGQTPATNRRVKIYEEEGGNKPAPRPFRMPWLTLYELLTDDQENNDENMPMQLVDAVEESDDFGFTDDLDKSTHMFRHPLLPEVEVEATEMMAPDGLTLVRAMSVSKVLEDIHGNVKVRTPLAHSVSATQQIGDGKGGKSKRSVFWNDDEIMNVEEKMADGVLVSRQTNRVEGQVVRGVSISRQISPHAANEALDLFGDELNLSDWMRGGSFGSSGKSGMLRSLSSDSSRPQSRAESQKTGDSAKSDSLKSVTDSPMHKRRTLEIFGNASVSSSGDFPKSSNAFDFANACYPPPPPLLRGLSRSQSKSSLATPTTGGAGGAAMMPKAFFGINASPTFASGNAQGVKLDVSAIEKTCEEHDEKDAPTNDMWNALLEKNKEKQGVLQRQV
jgi:hypothetical protein